MVVTWWQKHNPEDLENASIPVTPNLGLHSITVVYFEPFARCGPFTLDKSSSVSTGQAHPLDKLSSEWDTGLSAR